MPRLFGLLGPGTQVAPGTVGLPFAESGFPETWQRVADGDLSTAGALSLDVFNLLSTTIINGSSEYPDVARHIQAESVVQGVPGNTLS